MEKTIVDKIDGLTGLFNVRDFILNNKIEKFKEDELRTLCIKLAMLNANQQLDAFFQIAFNALESKKSNKKFWITSLITLGMSLTSLIVSSLKF